MTNTVERRVADLVAPIAGTLGLDVFDVEYAGGVVRVFLDREGGVDLDQIAEATRQLSRALDDADPLPGAYTLEVSSPGLERTLRTPEHFSWAIGREVALRLIAGVEGDRRVSGTVTGADDRSVTVLLDQPSKSERTVLLEEIDKARTTFRWGGAPKPSSAEAKAARRAGAQRAGDDPSSNPTEPAGAGG